MASDEARILPAQRDLALRDWLCSPEPREVEGFEIADTIMGIPQRHLESRRLTEWVLRFPSAPIYGINRVADVAYRRDRTIPPFHSYRVLTGVEYRGSATDVYLLHHGLNETANLNFLYRLADEIIDGDQGRVCVIRPFPAHLTRHPYSGTFSPTPLDNYLEDAGELFRQYLRYMIESRWFLSVIAPLVVYNTAAGADLLGARSRNVKKADDRRRSRNLDKLIGDEWRRCARSSKTRMKRHVSPPGDEFDQCLDVAVKQLRALLGHDARFLRYKDPKVFRGKLAGVTPRVHTIGYSLGGYAAQSQFFSWPFLFGGCATILSGGALRELTPTAFAHPEEWQTVVHALRYELDDSTLYLDTLRPRLLRKKDRRKAASAGWVGVGGRSKPYDVAGVEGALFDFLLRTFYEVFEQEHRNAYKSRLVEFNPRLMFVVGGSDQIVRTQSVLDAAPDEQGSNLFQIANISHFLGQRPADPAEEPLRTFWVPEIARLMRRFLEEAENLRQDVLTLGWLDDKLQRPVNPEVLEELTRADPVSWTTGAPLSPVQFDDVADQIAARVERRNGRVIVADGGVVPLMLRPRAMREHAGAIFHSDRFIVRHLAGLIRRADLIHRSGRGYFVIPADSRKRYVDTRVRSSSKSETAIGLLPAPVSDRRKEWKFIKKRWAASTWRFDGYDPAADERGGRSRPHDDCSRRFGAWLRTASEDEAPTAAVTQLPGIWLWVDDDFTRVGGRKCSSPGDVMAGLHKTLTASIGHLPKRDRKDPKTVLEAIEEWFEKRVHEHNLICLEVSRAAYNPRYTGRLLVDGRDIRRIVAHLASSLAWARPMAKKK